MSFFGFDTSLPKDRPPGEQPRGIFENPDPFAEIARVRAQGFHEDDDDVYVSRALPLFISSFESKII